MDALDYLNTVRYANRYCTNGNTIPAWDRVNRHFINTDFDANYSDWLLDAIDIETETAAESMAGCK